MRLGERGAARGGPQLGVPRRLVRACGRAEHDASTNRMRARRAGLCASPPGTVPASAPGRSWKSPGPRVAGTRRWRPDATPCSTPRGSHGSCGACFPEGGGVGARARRGGRGERRRGVHVRIGARRAAAACASGGAARHHGQLYRCNQSIATPSRLWDGSGTPSCRACAAAMQRLCIWCLCSEELIGSAVACVPCVRSLSRQIEAHLACTSRPHAAVVCALQPCLSLSVGHRLGATSLAALGCRCPCSLARAPQAVPKDSMDAWARGRATGVGQPCYLWVQAQGRDGGTAGLFERVILKGNG
jgi:hypothetical protein